MAWPLPHAHRIDDDVAVLSLTPGSQYFLPKKNGRTDRFLLGKKEFPRKCEFRNYG
jgi:hypothetical protein